MEKPKLILFYELCRLCLEKPGMKNMFEAAELVEDIFLCTGVRVNRSDNLPPKVCMVCLEVVVKAKRLRVLAKENETHLKSLFDDDNNTEESDRTYYEKKFLVGSSSTDSDRTAIIESTNKNEKVVHKKSKKSKSNKRRILDSSEPVTNAKTIAVRKDLFDSSAAVTSSTNDIASSVTEIKSEHNSSKFIERDEFGDYVCEVCKKKFNVWKKFYLHQRHHNRNIICPFDACGKKFATNGDRDKHVRTHTGERPYSCEKCQRSFTQRGSLKSHRETVHGVIGVTEEFIITT